jgi:hypothetical protein
LPSFAIRSRLTGGFLFWLTRDSGDAEILLFQKNKLVHRAVGRFQKQ